VLFRPRGPGFDGSYSGLIEGMRLISFLLVVGDAPHVASVDGRHQSVDRLDDLAVRSPQVTPINGRHQSIDRLRNPAV